MFGSARPYVSTQPKQKTISMVLVGFFFITPGCEFSYVLMFSIYSEHLFLKNKIIYFVGIPETRLWIGTKHQQVLSNHMDQELMQDLGAIL